MNHEQRLDAVLAAVRSLAAHPDPAALADGLSPQMARACLTWACQAIDPSSLAEATSVPGRPPRLAGVVAARGVFTAPLEWVALLAAAGAEVVLKAPLAAPAFGAALAQSFRACGLPVSCTTARELPALDALVAMGSDQAIAALAEAHARARLSLHGHRFSVAVVRGAGPALAAELAQDALLYDGRGCFTPVAVLHLGSQAAAEQLVHHLGEQLEEHARILPPGSQDPLMGPEWRRRTGLARALGRLARLEAPTTALLPATAFEAVALPGFLPVYHLARLDAVRDLLAPRQSWLAACATDLDPAAPLYEIGFERICRPGTLQRPPLLRCHGGREMLRPLMLRVSDV